MPVGTFEYRDEAFPAWRERATGRLLADGYAGACESPAELPGGAAEVVVALNYLAGHRDRLTYAARLRRGQSIGSGLVEGTIKQRVNLRLKRTGARWRASARWWNCWRWPTPPRGPNTGTHSPPDCLLPVAHPTAWPSSP